MLVLCVRGVAAQAPPQAQLLVARVHAWNSAMLAWEDGAGVVIGADSSFVWIATARHVVAYYTTEKTYKKFDTVWVAFYTPAMNGDSARAEVVLLGANAPTDSTQSPDLAVLRIPRRGAPLPAAWSSVEFDRLGDPRKLKLGEVVYPMGCPRDVCWEVPVTGDGLVSVQPTRLLFQSTFVGQGSSGGALFNEQWEVVGIVTVSSPPFALAMSMRQVLSLLDSARVPVELHEPRLPRSGYHTTFEATMLTPLSVPVVPDSLSLGSTQPSGRVTFTTRGRSAITWRVTGLRLATYGTTLTAGPDGVGLTTVTAGLGGVGLTLRLGRFSARPFAELGMGRVQTLYDRGGYHVAAGGTGTAKYVPLWTPEHTDGLGFGGGLELEFVIVPHISLAGTFARWKFSATPTETSFPTVFAGGGLRWSR
jgi:hypothetical protein